MATMKACRIHTYGPPDVIQYEETVRPEPGAGELLIQVHAAGINAVDWKLRAGYLQQMISYALPITLGLDFSGSVALVGSGPSGHAVGDEVYGRTDLMRLSTYAEYVIVQPGDFTSKPHSVDHIHAAAVPLVALTAWQSLISGVGDALSIGLSGGQRVLIHGAAGGVGSFAVQLAKWRGAYVIATARGEDADFVRNLGADEVIDFTQARFEDVVGQVDAVLDLVGGDVQSRSWKVLGAGGTLATTMGLTLEEDASRRDARAIEVMTQTDVGHLDEIARLIDEGSLRVVVSEVFPLAQAAQAHAHLEAGRVNGKIVLEVDG